MGGQKVTFYFRNLFWAAIAIAMVVAFDHAMAVDRTNLCSNDATAFQGC